MIILTPCSTTTTTISSGALQDTYFNTCVNETNGQSINCLMTQDRPLYISCIDNCTLIKCGGDGDSSNSSGNSNSSSSSTWCQNYQILSLMEEEGGQEELDKRGYVPSTYNCFNEQGSFSDEPGKILLESATSTATAEEYYGTCTFDNGKVVERSSIEGPFAYCESQRQASICQLETEEQEDFGDNDDDIPIICNGTYAGSFLTFNYDPRWRPWYIDCREALRPRFSDTYIFFLSDVVGIKYTHPIFDKITGDAGNGERVLAGVLAVDMELGDIMTFLVSSFNETDFTVAIYEEQEPYKMIGLSTASNIFEWVLAEDDNQICTQEQINTTPPICQAQQLTILDFVNSDSLLEDRILQKAHIAIEDMKTIDSSNNNQGVTVREDDDDVASATYYATSLIYEQPEANLKWRIVITMPLENNPNDAITQEDGLYVLICIIASLGFLLCFLLFAAFYRKRNEEVVQFSDFSFTSAFIIGCSVLNLSLFCFLGEATDQACMIRTWVFYLLLSIALAPLLIKSYRIYKLLGSSIAQAMTVKMSNRQTFAVTLTINLVQALILLTFSYIDPPKATETIDLDAIVPTKSVVCSRETNAFLFTQGFYNFLLIAFGCYLAFLTRHIDTRFADAKALFFAMYNIFFTTMMLAIIFSSVDMRESGKIALFAIGIFWGK